MSEHPEFHLGRNKNKNRFFNSTLGNLVIDPNQNQFDPNQQFSQFELPSFDSIRDLSVIDNPTQSPRFNLGQFQTNNIGNVGDKVPEGFGLNFKTFGAISQGLGGIGNLAQGFAAIKSLGLARDSLNFQRDITNRNFEANRTTVNNRINDQNAFKTAQGRTDLANLVL